MDAGIETVERIPCLADQAAPRLAISEVALKHRKNLSWTRRSFAALARDLPSTVEGTGTVDTDAVASARELQRDAAAQTAARTRDEDPGVASTHTRIVLTSLSVTSSFDAEATVNAARQGQPEAFDSLFARNLPKLVAFIRARAGGVVAAKESVHDLAQSVCREALADLDKFDYRGEEAFRHWLFVRATRKICNRHRFHHRAKRDVSREAQDFAPSEDEASQIIDCYATLGSPSRIVGAREELERIEKALADLPDAQREAVALSRVAGLSYEEIAEQLDRSESSVRGLVMRGLARLAALLEEDA